MKKNFQYFVVLLAISSIECKNEFSRKEKNEIYFTLEKVLEPSGINKIKLALPQSTTKENRNSKENEAKVFGRNVNEGYFLEDNTNTYNSDKQLEEAAQIDYYLGLDLLKLDADSHVINHNQIIRSNYDKESHRNKIKDNETKFKRRNNLRFKKEIINGGFSASSPFEYRNQDPLTGSYSFGYRTFDQYREEMKTTDGTVYGNFGWVDKEGKWHHTTFVADQHGYRILSPQFQVDNSPTSANIFPLDKFKATTDIPFKLLTESSYESYSSSNKGPYSSSNKSPYSSSNKDPYSPVNPYRVKVGTVGEQNKYGNSQYSISNKEEPLLSNLKQKFNLTPPSSSTSYINLGQENKPSVESDLTNTPSLTVHSSIKNIYSPLHRGQLKPSLSPTKRPNGFKPTTQETITVTNLQDSFFNKLPLKPIIEDLSPNLERPLKPYSNFLTKWPDIRWPDNAENIIAPLLQSLGSLTGRSNVFQDQEYRESNSMIDNSKRAKSVYDSNNSNKEPQLTVNSNKIKRNPLFKTTNDQSLYRFGNLDYSNYSVKPGPLFLKNNMKPNSFSQVDDHFQNLKLINYNNANPSPIASNSNKEYILFIPFIFNLRQKPFPYVNLPVPYLQMSPTFNHLFLLYTPSPQTYPYKPLAFNMVTKPMTLPLTPEPQIEAHEHGDDDVDYLLLSDEFKVSNGSITNDPAYVNILDHQSNNRANNFGSHFKSDMNDTNDFDYQNISSSLPSIGSLNNTYDFEHDNTSSSFHPNDNFNETNDFKDKTNFTSEVDTNHDKQQAATASLNKIDSELADEKSKINMILIDNEDATHKEIHFRLSKPLLRSSNSVPLNKN